MRSIHDVIFHDVRTGKPKKLFWLKKRKLKGKQKDIDRSTYDELFEYLCHHQPDITMGAFYSDQAQQLYGKTTKDNVTSDVGPSELPIRCMLGLPLETNGASQSIDILHATLGRTEVKEILTQSGWQELRINGESIKTYAEFLSSVRQLDDFKNLIQGTQDLLFQGKVTLGLMKQLPRSIRTLLMTHMNPANVLRDVDNLCLGGKNSFLTIPSSDFSYRTFKLSSITQGGKAKYSLRRKYLYKRYYRLSRVDGFIEKLVRVKTKSTSTYITTIQEREFDFDQSTLKYKTLSGRTFSVAQTLTMLQTLLEKYNHLIDADT